MKVIAFKSAVKNSPFLNKEAIFAMQNLLWHFYKGL